MMGDKTGISWCDHTFNPWIGCTKVSEGCKFCYAERDNKRYSWVNGWGPQGERRRTSEANWKKPVQWAQAAKAAGVMRRVFCASLADVFDAEAPQEWRDELWRKIYITQAIGGLEWLILTKRPENIAAMMPELVRSQLTCVRLGVTAENQKNWDLRIPQLLDVWQGKNFVSIEPMISVVIMDQRVDWVICGAESGANVRPMNSNWVRFLRDQCLSQDTAFFLKQMVVDGKLTKEPYLDGRQWLEFPEA